MPYVWKLLYSIWHRLTYLLFLAVVRIYRILPNSVTEQLCLGAGNILLALKPRYRAIGHTNLGFAFPETSPEERDVMINRHFVALSHLLTDLFGIEKFSKEYAKEHVTLDLDEATAKALEHKSGRLFVAGHISSFEALPSCHHHLFGEPLYIVVRKMKHPLIDAWWNRQRERWGCIMIPREGATRKIMGLLRNGKTVGLLFDQNVRMAHGLFPNWFGRPASTTASVAMLALKTKVPLFVCGLYRQEEDSYQLKVRLIPSQDLVELASQDKSKATLELTQRCVDEFETHIRENPATWFWLHRRWKTSPPDSDLSNPY